MPRSDCQVPWLLTSSAGGKVDIGLQIKPCNSLLMKLTALCRRDDAPHQVKLGLINVGRLYRHRQRADPDAKVAGHASLKRSQLDEIGIALRAEVDGIRVDGEL